MELSEIDPPERNFEMTISEGELAVLMSAAAVSADNYPEGSRAERDLRLFVSVCRSAGVSVEKFHL